MDYLTPEHPQAFFEFPAKELPGDRYPEMAPYNTECPQCKGHGGWNLRLNAYKLPAGYADTVENRHKYVHFQMHCNHCNGWGYVKPEDANHVHDWQHVKNLGRCLNLYKCSICQKEWEVDSSD